MVERGAESGIGQSQHRWYSLAGEGAEKASGRGCAVAKGVSHSEMELETASKYMHTCLGAEGKPCLFIRRHTLDFYRDLKAVVSRMCL